MTLFYGVFSHIASYIWSVNFSLKSPYANIYQVVKSVSTRHELDQCGITLLLPDCCFLTTFDYVILKKERCLLEVHSFVDIVHTRSYKTHVFNVLAGQETIYFGYVGWFISEKKTAVPVHDTVNLETVSCPFILEVEVILERIKDGTFSE